MKKFLILLILISVQLVSAQNLDTLIVIDQKTFDAVITFSSENYSDVKKGNYSIRDYFNYSENGQKYSLPGKKIFFAIPQGSHPTVSLIDYESIRIKNTIPKENSNYINNESRINEYSNSILGQASKFTLRDFNCLGIELNNCLYNSLQRELNEISQVTLRITFERDYINQITSELEIKNSYDDMLSGMFLNKTFAEQFRITKRQTTKKLNEDWINYSQNYIKMAIVEDGIYRITPANLQSLGVNISSINAKGIKIFNRGKELSLFVNGEQDNSFDSGDFIEFYGEKNYSQISHHVINNYNEDYNVYLNRYTDTSYYFLTWSNVDGKRALSQSGFNSALNDTVKYYMHTDHYEDNKWFQFMNNDDIANQKPNWFKNKTWYWKWVSKGNRNYNFALDNLYENKNAKLSVKLASGGSNIPIQSHQLALRVGATKLDSQNVNRYHQALLQGSMNSSLLSNGNNVLKLTNHDNGTNPNILALDWYEVSYPRNLIFEANSKNFTLDQIAPNTEKIVKVNNITGSTFAIYRTAPTVKRIEQSSLQSGALLFSDTTSNSNSYCVANSAGIKTPQFIYNKQFSNLRSASIIADYVGITHKKFETGVNDYLSIVNNTYGYSTTGIVVQDIYDEFSYGYPEPFGIKKFVQHAIGNWSNMPEYLVLFGDANYDYKGYKLAAGAVGGKNYITAYGNPVSDNWFATNDTVSAPIPELLIGRIPINTLEELNHYKSKLTNNSVREYDEWNKRYLLFSGGRAEVPTELQLLKSVNDSVISRFIKPAPIGGDYTHFYRTIVPATDLGPYTNEEIQTSINSGGVFISYLGHSGTATWDNGINDASQLQNEVNGNSLITDFGCSTNKFAEPDIVCFGERYVLDNQGQAIGYVGNTSLGFLSTATSFPQLFYKELIEDSASIGLAHLKAKIKLYNQFGNSGANKLFVLTNTLLGDPVIKLKIPTHPNLFINEELISSNVNIINDNIDSVKFSVRYQNLGKVISDSLEIKITQSLDGNTIKENYYKKSIPFIKDSISFYLVSKDLPGNHSVVINLDPNNNIDELTEDDNTINYSVNVFSSSVRDLIPYTIENGEINNIKLIPPVFSDDLSNQIILQIDDSPDFANPTETNYNISDTYNSVNITGLENDRRYYLRYKINKSGNEFSPVKSFISGLSSKYVLSDSTSLASKNVSGFIYNNGLTFGIDTINISVLSAGWNAGATCVIKRDGESLLSNSFFAGMGIVVFNDSTLVVESSDWYQLFNQPQNMIDLTNFINNIKPGRIVAMGVADDAANNITTELKDAIKTLGSTKIDDLVFRGSWGIIGRKGADSSQVIEVVKSPFEGTVVIDTNHIVNNKSGKIITSIIGPVKQWKTLTFNMINSNNVTTSYRPIGIRIDGTKDTLEHRNIINPVSDLSYLDPNQYQKAIFEIFAEDLNPTPGGFVINSIGVDHTEIPELGLSSKLVQVSTDSIEQGESVMLNYSFFNAGITSIDSFRVNVNLIHESGLKENLINKKYQNVNADSLMTNTIEYQSYYSFGKKEFEIIIDEENIVTEFYKDNNQFAIPFFIKPDSTVPSVNLTFNNSEIMDGDYISDKPEIRIELNDPSLIPVTDTSSLQLVLDNKIISYSANSNLIEYSYSNTNPKMTVLYKPVLDNGEHKITVFAKDASGNSADTNGISKTFIVDSNFELLELYNYPNPFKSDTYFTFKLTQIPEELSIKIFTVAGRLIKVINIAGSEMSFDFNRVYWDGRDQDNDILANGVYIYKISSKLNGELKTITKKLAIVR